MSTSDSSTTPPTNPAAIAEPVRKLRLLADTLVALSADALRGHTPDTPEAFVLVPRADLERVLLLAELTEDQSKRERAAVESIAACLAYTVTPKAEQ